ncbi:hypothetical protein, partial [Pseudonocardia lacus]|uniref:hypothetical protein n=1 Tax=Pseudonocardia lacus TaxID=2835865 RepID=UPI001BDBEB80
MLVVPVRCGPVQVEAALVVEHQLPGTVGGQLRRPAGGRGDHVERLARQAEGEHPVQEVLGPYRVDAGDAGERVGVDLQQPLPRPQAELRGAAGPGRVGRPPRRGLG